MAKKISQEKQFRQVSLFVRFLVFLSVLSVFYLTAATAATHTAAEASDSKEVTSEKQSINNNQSDKHKTEKEQLGQMLFFDVNLSSNRTMSCSTCHNPATGLVDQRNNEVGDMASLGADGTSLGDRNAPTAGYAMLSPHFQKNTGKNKSKSAFLGGQFWDGREPTLAGQAGGPPLNPIEMGMPDKASVVKRLQENPFYIKTFKLIYGDEVFNDSDLAYTAMTQSIEAFEKTDFFAPFDSKYDRFLKGEYEMTVLEDLGRSLFFSSTNVNCSQCHMLKREDALNEPFSNFEYRNIGVPENTALRAKNGVTQKDLGLYQNPLAQTDDNKGKFKVSTLRNVAVTGPYMHNGVFKDLRTVVEFYDQYNNPLRKNNPETGKPWRQPEVPENVALGELKAKVLTERKVDALIAFMETLTDKRYEYLLKKDVKNK